MTLCAGAAGASLLAQSGQWREAGAWLAGALVQTVLQPDLDQLDNGGYYGLYVIRETFGRAGEVAERVFVWYWMPYARALAHRSALSHAPVIGTAARLLYAFWWLIPYVILTSYMPNAGFAYMMAAVAVCDFLHWCGDWRVWPLVGVFRQ